MSKHTPGPWEVEPDEAQEYWCSGSHYNVGPALGIRNPEDAALIAAAPEMYEALKKVLPTLERLKIEADCSYGHNFSQQRADSARGNYAAAINALAKAERK